MATFEEIVEDESVLEEGNPFTYLKVEGDYEFTNPNTLLLEGDGIIFVNDNHGRLHLIVKPNREVDLRIKADDRNRFDGIENYPKTAFNAVASKPFFGDSSSLDITLRGGSMLALAATDKGDRGVWDKSGTTFHLETVQRDITQPNERNPTATDFISFEEGDGLGLMLNLTAPYGDYSEQGTYSLIWGADGADYQVSIKEIRYAPSGGFAAGLTGFETTDEELVFEDSPIGSNPYDTLVELSPYRKGFDADGREFNIEIGRDARGLFYVVVDKAVASKPFESRYEASVAAASRYQALLQRTTLIEPAQGFGFELALGGVAIVALILALIFGRRS